MTIVNISDLKPGMTLATPVLNAQGGVLLNEGVELTDRHLHILRSWGILQADIEGVESSQIKQIDFQDLPDETKKQIEDTITERFSLCSPSPVMDEIKRLARKYTVKEAIENSISE